MYDINSGKYKNFNIKAEKFLNKESGRSWPIVTGYRPGFSFIDRSQTSGMIDLLGKECMNIGESGVVEVSFFSNALLGDIQPGVEVKFYEGPREIGIAKVLEVIGWVEVV